MAHHLAIQFVDQLVYRGIHVLVSTFGKHVAALDMNVAFRFLSTFFLGLVFNAQLSAGAESTGRPSSTDSGAGDAGQSLGEPCRLSSGEPLHLYRARTSWHGGITSWQAG